MSRQSGRRIFDYREFSGWARFPRVLAPLVEPERDFRVLDMGGGANPMLAPEVAARITYALLDIDAAELAKAPPVYGQRFHADATIGVEDFVAIVGRDAYDLVYSHMFIEHVRDPGAIHRNIFAALRPGGRCAHAYPIAHNIPLALNALLPDALSRRIVQIAQPERDLDGNLGKFPAFYRACYPPSRRATRFFESFGYEVETHHGYAGHAYYRRIPPLDALERVARRIAVVAQLPWVTFGLVILRKPAGPGPGRRKVR
ncbi:class I SAM-dependent methyltransferase [Amaricoccus sp. W119]|uniref:class I SAM-dependent methyltransferase n=1 Tax=Amaricoccus sp. W119 TaxID=3391833 RepID=UPI0039A4FC02